MSRNRHTVLGSISETDEMARNIRSRGYTRSYSLPPPNDVTSIDVTSPRGSTQSTERSSVAASTDEEKWPTSKPIVARKLPKRLHFGREQEDDDLYLVDMEQPKICRRRSGSITNPQLMTDDERRLLSFMQKQATSTEVDHVTRPRSYSRVYTDRSFFVDPRLKFSDLTLDPWRVSTPVIHILPPIHKHKPIPLIKRDFRPEKVPVVDYIDEDTWTELKQCRYLRPKSLRFRKAYGEEKLKREDYY